MAWAPAGEGKKRRRRADAVPDAVPDAAVASAARTPETVTRRASPGRARGGATWRAAVGAVVVPDADAAMDAFHGIATATAATAKKLQ